MDAFSVSLANGLNEPAMRGRKMACVAGVYAVFQFLMPLAGWLCVHTIVKAFSSLARFVPWIALLLLAWIGGKMLFEGIRGDGEEASSILTPGVLVVQGIATSIDALSVGFTIAEYDAGMALEASLIIGGITFFICLAGLRLGRAFGTRLSGRASILGGVILIAIGVEIFIKGILLG